MNTMVIGEKKYFIMAEEEYDDAMVSSVDVGIDIGRFRCNKLILYALNRLKFYANENNYLPDISEVTGVEHGTGLMQYDISNICADNGQTARDAIAVMEVERDRGQWGE